MTQKYLYHYKMSRKKRSTLFIRMGFAALGYIVILSLVEHFTEIVIPHDIYNISLIAFALAAMILFTIAWWYINNDVTYEAYITDTEFSVFYPQVESWSFKVNIDEILKIEQRQNHAGGGKSRLHIGLLMKNGDFYEIIMNYGNDINKMFKVLQAINPKITYPKTVKTRYLFFGRKVR